MAHDREILHEVWNGKIPVCFTLASEEVESLEQPESVFLMVPRLSYFPLVTDRLQRYFTKYVGQDRIEELWLEFDGQPLKWHYPVGVLYDLYANSELLPWNITVHFLGFPEEELLHYSSKDTVESHFMSVVKEADSLKHRGQIINSMQKKDHKQLWLGLLHDKFDQFWTVNKKLMESSGEDMFKSIPYRIYQTEKPYIQTLFRPQNSEGNSSTLRDLLQDVLPNYFSEDGQFKKAVIIQGLEPSLDVPILWLSEHLSHPDNFLHICLTNRESLS